MSKVLITGCSSGFGDLTARTLARRGHTVFATMRGVEGRNAEPAESLRTFGEEVEGEVRVHELDVTDEDSVRSAVAEVEDRAGAPDVVINNAGSMYLGVTEAFTPRQLVDQLDVNLVGPHRVARAALPGMRDRGSGLIVNLSSVAGRLVLPCGGLYNASKFGLEALTESLRYELAPFGVEVVLVEPGPFGTNLFPSTTGPEDEDRVADYGDRGRDVYAGVMAVFEQVFEDPEAPTEAEEVAEVLVELVEAEPGDRPLRTVVGVDFGVRELNAAIEPFRRGALEGIGMPELDRVEA